MADFNTKVPSGDELPVTCLISGDPDDPDGSKITPGHLYYSQYNWRLVKLYRLTPSRRKELCDKLLRLLTKMTPDLEGSDAQKLWRKVSDNPGYPDEVMESLEMW